MYQNLTSNNHHRSGSSGMQEVIQMCSSFDNNKSTKGASKLRRDLINGEIANLRDLLPLPSSTRQRLSQLQLMALVCVYVRKANYFQQVFKRYHELGHPYNTPNIGFSKALSGFLIMMTQNGKLLYISDNAAEYLGHSMEDLLIHGDSVYDIIDKADHGTVQAELLRSTTNNNTISNIHGSNPEESSRLFLCRMNVSRNARRQMRFGDQKVVLLQGHYMSYLPLCSRNEPVFVATCTPVAMPETRESVVQGATNIFTSIHSMDMKYMHIDKNGEHYLGYTRSELGGISWYQLVHWNYMREAQSKHRLISQSEQEKSCILLLRLQTRSSEWIWVHAVLQVKDGSDSSNVGNNSSNSQPQQSSQQSVIVATNQVLNDREAEVMRANAWIYHYYTVQTKLQYGLAYTENNTGGIGSSSSAASPQAAAAAARLVAAAAYFPSQQLINYGNHHQAQFTPHQLSPEIPSGSPTGYIQNGNTYPNPHSGHTHYYPTHAYEMPSQSTISGTPVTKDSPLDFSLAATPTNLFEFHSASTYPGSTSYWAHHQYSHNGSTGTSSAYTRQSEVSPNNTSSSHNWHSSNQNQSNRASTSATTLGLSPKQSSSSPRKRTKKSSELVNQTSSTPLTVSSITPEIIPKRTFFSSNSETTVGTVTTTTLFPYHTHNRSRSLYKLLGSGDEESLQTLPGVKEDTSTNSISLLSCPLTPSPIWEGQAQRVPDLQYYSSHNGDSNDRVHCVPTYHHYHLPPPVPGHNSTGAFNYYGLACLSHNHLYTSNSTSVLESGSPNKENRLPPTPPESDNGRENEDSKPLKWESL